jgi:hypothetical protein
MALVLGVMALMALSGQMAHVSSSTSANTGTAPVQTTALAAAIHESSGTITSWPGPMPRASRARCRAPVQLEVARACFIPTNRAKASSNRLM